MSAAWRFTGQDGVQRVLGTEELRSALATGTLASSTLVWREGMEDPSPAFTVPELSSAVIGAARRGSIPPTSQTRDKLPSLPGLRTPTERPGSGGVGLSADDYKKAGLSFPNAAPAPGDGHATRGPMRTLVGIDPYESAPPENGASGSARPPAFEDAPSTAVDYEDEQTLANRDVAPLIPPAPRVPMDTAAVLPKDGTRPRRPPTIPPPLASSVTPPPENVSSKPAVPHRPTLMGMATKKTPSMPPGPPPRRQPSLPSATEVAAKTGDALPSPLPDANSPRPPAVRSRPPPPPVRRPTPMAQSALPQTGSTASSAPNSAGPKRLSKTLEMDKVKDEPVPVRRPAPPTPRRDPAKTKAPTEPQKTPAPPQVSSAKPAASPRAEGTEIIPSPIVASASKPATDAASKTSDDPSKSVEAPERVSEPGPVSLRDLKKTLEMTLDTAETKDPSPPRAEKPARKPDEETTTTFQFERDVLKAKSAGAGSTRRDRSGKNRPSDSSELASAAAEIAADSASLESASATSGDDPGLGEAVRAKSIVTTTGEVTNAPVIVRKTRSSLPPRRKDALQVPVSSLIAASAVWVLGLVAFFFVGRATTVGDGVATARDGIAEALLVWTPPGTPMFASNAEPKPCWVARQPSRWAKDASKNIPFDMRADGAASMRLGFAIDDQNAVGIAIDPKTGKFEEVFKKKLDETISRVSPLAGGPDFFVGVRGSRTLLPTDTNPPFFLVFEETGVSVSDTAEGELRSIWALQGEGKTSSEQIQSTGDAYFVTFRRGDDVHAGYIGSDRALLTPLGVVAGSEGKGGKPKSGFNGKEVAVVFADKPDKETPWQVRIGRAAKGAVPEKTDVVTVPEGGPGGEMIAPDIVGLADGRWLLMWTEGTSGERAIRAQTFDAAFSPLGDPIALSPPAGDFGQAVLAVVGSYTTVVFLQRGDDGFEMWGAILQCG